MHFVSDSLAGNIANAIVHPYEYPVFCICAVSTIAIHILNRPNHMKPKTALAIVLSLVITGEAIAEFCALNMEKLMGIAIVIFSCMVIYSVRKSQKQ